MNQKTYQTCPNCGEERLPFGITECLHCGYPLFSRKLQEEKIYPQATRTWGRRSLVLAAALILVLCVALGIRAVVVAPRPVSPRVTPKQSAVPMVRVTIQLLDVYCDAKQDRFTHDQFYMLSAFTAAGQSAQLYTRADLFQSIDIDDGEDLPIPTDPRTVFSALVPQQGSVKGVFVAFNDANGLSWQNLPDWITDVTQGVSSGLKGDGINTSNVDSLAPATVTNLAINTWYQTANLNSGNANDLGAIEENVPASGAASETGTLNFEHNGTILVGGGWNYTVKFQIIRSPVTGNAQG